MSGRESPLKHRSALWICMLMLLSAAFGQPAEAVNNTPGTQPAEAPSPAVADASQMTDVENVVEEWMVPVTAESLVDGEYPVEAESSSSMFRIEKAVLRVEDGRMTAAMTMGGKGYLYVYPGSAEEAAKADQNSCVPYTENTEGAHCFTIPVEALDAPVPCAAFSKNKELWYDRTLVFRADSLPTEAFREGFLTTAKTLDLPDGEYTAEVSLSGGSGKAGVESPAVLIVRDGQCEAHIVWSSKNYDYMIVNGEKLLPENSEGNSAFRIPVLFFDRPMSVKADTVAMSQPHEITYRLCFSSESLRAAEETENSP